VKTEIDVKQLFTVIQGHVFVVRGEATTDHNINKLAWSITMLKIST